MTGSDEGYLRGFLMTARPEEADAGRVREGALAGKPYLRGVAAMLAHPHLSERVVAEAVGVNLLVEGNGLDYYAISYIGDRCVNDCSYCGHGSKAGGERSVLTPEEMALDMRAALRLGPTELCILAGEHPSITPELLVEAGRIALREDRLRGLARLSFNVAPMDVDGFRRLRDGIGFPLQYRLFQESYHAATYARVHRAGPKRDGTFRLGAQERALAAGFDHVGIGALLGLNEEPGGNEYELLALVDHAYRLQAMSGRLPFSASLPRVQPVAGGSFVLRRPVEDDDYVRYHAILKLALPTTKLILTRRETPGMFDRLRPLLGMEDLAPRPGVGGNFRAARFQNGLGDPRSAEEILADVRAKGFAPRVKLLVP